MMTSLLSSIGLSAFENEMAMNAMFSLFASPSLDVQYALTWACDMYVKRGGGCGRVLVDSTYLSPVYLHFLLSCISLSGTSCVYDYERQTITPQRRYVWLH